MGCHLGWHFAVGCPLRGGRGKYKQKGLLFHQKQLRKKKKKPFEKLRALTIESVNFSKS
jgi:hypothetical protein